MGRKQIRCHGDDTRFEILADYIYEKYKKNIRYIADVAGGQGALSRILNKKYNYQSEVIDPRGYTLKGVPSRQCEYSADMADYYDLIVGLHPDEATIEVAKSALIKPVILIPCCNFWTREKKLGSKELVEEICGFFKSKNIKFETQKLNFAGPKNMAIITSGFSKENSYEN